MIIDQIKNAPLYFALSPNLAEGLRFLGEANFDMFAPGRHEIPGKNFYLLSQEYETKPLEKGAWEAHRKFIDIQVALQGEERVGYANIERMTPGIYEEERDFLSLAGSGDFFTLSAGTFVIFLPQDVHMPGLRLEQPARVRKVVLKIPVG